jgi:asparagine synthase (glutamine-hydrolysing)
MFALAIWDGRRSRLLLARDRTGKKPLFYTTGGGRLTFASEIKSLLAAPWVGAAPDLERAADFLTWGYVPAPATMYTGVLQVPPASTIVYDAGGLHDPNEYWDALPERQDLSLGQPFEHELRELMTAAVRRRLITDVPLGALLSGGIDSSLVVALMSSEGAAPVRTFSIGFPEDDSFDERSYARQVAERFGTEHTEFAVKADAVGLLDRLLWHHDQPFGDSSAIPTFLVSQLAREHVTVALNGDGGDEVFAGYDRFRAAALSGLTPEFAARGARLAARALPSSEGYFSLRRRIERFGELSGESLERRYEGWIAMFAPDAATALVRHRTATDPRAAMLDCYERARHLPELDRLLYANFKTYLPDDLAVKMDRMSMANSLETRSPFLDTAVIELLARLPARRKIGLRRVKPVLRRAFRDLLPAEVWDRPKHGFGVPVGQWLHGELGTLFEDEVLSPGARTADLLDRDAVSGLWREHRARDAQHGYRLWTILMLERWLRRASDPPSLRPPAAAIAA